MAFPPTVPALARALDERAYNDPTPVQTAVLAPAAGEADLLVSSQTGSGKTVAFGLAIAKALLGDADELPRAGDPLALIVAPTRELALQVSRELEWLYKYAGARIVTCVGGMDPRAEKKQLWGGAHIVVGTPGRLRDHLERSTLKTASIKAVVLDEADEMLDLGFREDLEFILETTPKERRTLLFSATLPREIVTLAKQYQRDAMRIEATGGTRGHADIEYRVMRIVPQDAVHAVVNVLRYIDSPAALVFCNTRDGVRHLHAALVERGFAAVSLSGEFTQAERNHALQALRDGRARVCVATDVAARGIDLPNLGLVIHADLPNDAETLQHRSGRTGRAGRKGVSVLLLTPAARRRGERMLATAKIQAAWTNPPSPDAIRKLDNERLLDRLLTAEVGGDDDLAMARQLLAKRPAEEIAAALVRVHRAQLPAAEDIADTGPPDNRAKQQRSSSTDDRSTHAPKREPRSGLENSVWYRLNVGRQRKADPKWLIPEICRQGGITKREIGAIRIFDLESKFEIDATVAERFSESIAKVTKGDIFISASEAPADGGHTRRAPPSTARTEGRNEGRAEAPSSSDQPREKPRDKPRWTPEKKQFHKRAKDEGKHRGDDGKRHGGKPHKSFKDGGSKGGGFKGGKKKHRPS